MTTDLFFWIPCHRTKGLLNGFDDLAAGLFGLVLSIYF